MILKFFVYCIAYTTFILGMILGAIVATLLVRDLYLYILRKKMDNAYRNRVLILNAICNYNIAIIQFDYSNYENNRIPYSVLEPRKNTIFRFWDWGYTRLVDRDTYNKIKPYIKK